MDVQDIRRLFAFNRWANVRVLEAVRPLEPHELTRDLATSHRSIRGTLVHALWSEWVWLRRWRGESPMKPFTEDEFPDVAAIESRWAEVERDRDDLLAALTENRLHTPVSYRNLRGEPWTYALVDMMQHVLHHSSYHRGQVVTLLRQSGRVPPATDFLVYLDESG